MSDFFVHEKGICDSEQVGVGTKIWAFAHVLPGASVGAHCNICDHVFIENDVVIGDRVTIKCGVQLWDGVRVESDVFIGPNVTFTNDKYPRSKMYPERFLPTVVESGASIGANATILPGLRIVRNALIGAGAVVARDVPPNAKVVGNPGKIIGYVTESRVPEKIEIIPSKEAASHSESKVAGVRFYTFPAYEDLRGALTVGEMSKDLPFSPKRFFMVHKVPSREVRGEHAHRKCQQLLMCVSGSCRVLVDNGEIREEYILDSPNIGLLMPAMIWGTQYHYSSDAVLLVFASELYDPSDYIRDYGEFLSIVNGN
jgi:acetyltransferase-like isoleucine patch superfamily enzyme/dTDP-4-dehydrorhamnose 3,5-epimerase-like enzyme